MKKIIFLFILLSSLSNVFSQQDPEAKKILDKLSVETKNHKSIKAAFEVEYKNINDKSSNKSKGTIIIKGDKYKLNFMGTESFFDGKTLWNYIEEVKEVNISEPQPTEEDIFSNPKSIFTIYEEGYKYQLVNEFSKDNINFCAIDLYPEDIDEEYSRIRLIINKDNQHLSSATIFGKEGSHYIIKIYSYQTNLDFKDSFFSFDKTKYPKTEIIDLR